MSVHCLRCSGEAVSKQYSVFKCTDCRRKFSTNKKSCLFCGAQVQVVECSLYHCKMCLFHFGLGVPANQKPYFPTGTWLVSINIDEEGFEKQHLVYQASTLEKVFQKLLKNKDVLFWLKKNATSLPDLLELFRSQQENPPITVAAIEIQSC